MRNPVLIFLFIGFSQLSPSLSSASVRKGYTLTVRKDTLITDKGQPISSLQFVSDKAFYSSRSSADGELTFFVVRDFKQADPWWAAKGWIVCFDTWRDCILWQMETKAFDVVICEKHIVIQNATSATCLSTVNGRLVWERYRTSIRFVEMKSILKGI